MKPDVRNFTVAPELRIPRSFLPSGELIYPDSDGKPMADNTLQFEYIVSLKQGFEDLYKDDANVFVAGDLLWYPVEGNNTLCAAPDVMIAFGRPKGYRGSYMQWKENNIPPAFAIEVLSPSNRGSEMGKKAAFYLRHGVLEYLIYDPNHGTLGVLTRDESGEWEEEVTPNGWKSVLTGVSFFLSEGALVAVRPDGKKFETYAEARERAETERQRADENAKHREIAEEEIARLTALLQQAGVNPS